MTIKIRNAHTSDASTVAALVHALLVELTPDESEPPTVESVVSATLSVLLEGNDVWAFLAEDDENHAVGLLTLNECAAIYAGGKFGEISELYVVPEFRAAKLGQQLIEKAFEFGRSKAWKRLEVGAPDVPRWNRTVSFYKENGFKEVGPRLSYVLHKG